MKKYEYSSNNSGGHWWLTDADWYHLAEDGWTVNWVKDREDKWLKDGDRWLGALATSATIEAESLEAAIESFERVTGQSVEAQGCDCCGQPHYIGEAYEW